MCENAYSLLNLLRDSLPECFQEEYMNIIIAGSGNVGSTLASYLNSEGHDITVIDLKSEVVENVTSECDAMGVIGNCTSLHVLEEAGVENADLMIAVTGNDEVNLLACLMARKAGGVKTIARISNPLYQGQQIAFLKDELGLSMIVNPQRAAAREMARLLKYPQALRVESFAKSRVELVTVRIEENMNLAGRTLKEFRTKVNSELLITTVERDGELYIPGGDFELKVKDEISIVGTSTEIALFFKRLGMQSLRTTDMMIIGGGNTAVYLAREMIGLGVKVKIIERDRARCEALLDELPDAMIIHGDGTDKELLMEEGLMDVHAFVSTTDFDEENIMLSLYAQSVCDAKCITKVHRVSYENLLSRLEVGSTIYPKFITAEHIIKYVRDMNNSEGSNIETLHKMYDNRLEMLEFSVSDEKCPILDTPLMEMKLKNNVIIVSITHMGRVEIAGGHSVIKKGDTVVVATTNKGITDIKGLLK